MVRSAKIVKLENRRKKKHKHTYTHTNTTHSDRGNEPQNLFRLVVSIKIVQKSIPYLAITKICKQEFCSVYFFLLLFVSVFLFHSFVAGAFELLEIVECNRKHDKQIEMEIIFIRNFFFHSVLVAAFVVVCVVVVNKKKKKRHQKFFVPIDKTDKQVSKSLQYNMIMFYAQRIV